MRLNIADDGARRLRLPRRKRTTVLGLAVLCCGAAAVLKRSKRRETSTNHDYSARRKLLLALYTTKSVIFGRSLQWPIDSGWRTIAPSNRDLQLVSASQRRFLELVIVEGFLAHYGPM